MHKEAGTADIGDAYSKFLDMTANHKPKSVMYMQIGCSDNRFLQPWG